MKVIKGGFYILLFFFIGQIISHLINNFIPGSIIGMILLFVALSLGVISEDSVGKVADGLTSNMSIFFIPAGVGVLAVSDLKGSWLTILTVCSVTTALVIVVVAFIQEQMEKHRK